MSRRNYLSYQIPSVHDILQSKINEENIDVENGLSAQDDENLFLVASMAFLRQQLNRKLNEDTPSGNSRNRLYSDMLLFETGGGQENDRFYIRLKNCDKFDDIKKSEISIPESMLSSDQLLPTAKKPKLITLSKLFGGSKSKHSLKEKRSKSVLRLFKRASKPHESITLSADDYLKPKGYESNDEYEQNYSSESSWSQSIKIKCKRNAVDKNLVELLPALSNVNLSPSVKENFRHSRTSLSTVDRILIDENMDCYSAYDEEEKISYVRKEKRTHNGRLKDQQSKLSVCLEDESESENEFNRIASKMSYNNFPDELKANLSPEILQTIINEMIVYLEETPARNP